MAGVHHSNSAVEKLYEMTIDKKKTHKGVWFKRVACFALAFAVLVVGGEFGVNAIQNNRKATDALSVMVAYAGDNGKLSFGRKSEQEIFYGIYKAPIDDKKACQEADVRFAADKTKLLQNLDELSETGSYGSYGNGNYYGYNRKEDKYTTQCYTLQGGWFELNLEDYSDVEFLKVNNESEYGVLLFDYLAEDTKFYNDDSEIPPEELEKMMSKDLLAHEFTITGDDLRFSQRSGWYECGLGKYETNKGYFLEWNPSDEFVYATGENPNFDLSQIKDTITFTVEFNDGTDKTASLNLYFDKDGYMHFE